MKPIFDNYYYFNALNGTYGTDEEPTEATGESGDTVFLIVFSMLLSE